MMMKNIRKNYIVLILFVMYSIIVIFSFKNILFNNNSLIFWIGYLFTIFAFIMTIIINKELFKENTESFNIFPLLITNYTYLILQMIVSLIIIPLLVNYLDLIIAIEVIILAIFLIINVLLLKSREYIESIDKDIKNELSFIKNLEKELNILNIKISTNENNNTDNIKKEFEELKDLVKYSNPISNNKTDGIEEYILKDLDELKFELKNNNSDKVLDLINSMKEDINKRTTQSKTVQDNILDLKERYQNKEVIARKIIKEHFPPPQLTYDRFINEINNWNTIFIKQSELALTIIDIAPRYTKELEDEVTKIINTLKSIVEKMEELTVELTISLSNSSKKVDVVEIEELLSEMQKVIDSVKEYD